MHRTVETETKQNEVFSASQSVPVYSSRLGLVAIIFCKKLFTFCVISVRTTIRSFWTKRSDDRTINSVGTTHGRSMFPRLRPRHAATTQVVEVILSAAAAAAAAASASLTHISSVASHRAVAACRSELDFGAGRATVAQTKLTRKAANLQPAAASLPAAATDGRPVDAIHR